METAGRLTVLSAEPVARMLGLRGLKAMQLTSAVCASAAIMTPAAWTITPEWSRPILATQLLGWPALGDRLRHAYLPFLLGRQQPFFGVVATY